MAKKLAKGIEVKPGEIAFRLLINHEGAFAPFIFRAKKTFPLILCVRQKHPFSRSIELMTAPSQVLKIRRPDDWHLPSAMATC